MIRLMVIGNVLILLGMGSVLAPVEVSAKSAGVHQSAHHPIKVAPTRHHRNVNRFIWFGSRYYGPYDYGQADDVAPPPREKPVTENRRGCEPQTYSVPSSEGGESQVTILRC
jgi:hypothetical protein